MPFFLPFKLQIEEGINEQSLNLVIECQQEALTPPTKGTFGSLNFILRFVIGLQKYKVTSGM